MDRHDRRQPRKLSIAALIFIFGDGIAAAPILYPFTGHFYDFIPAAGITWTEANTQAPMYEYLGHSAYLVTISGQGENDFLYNSFNRQFWEGWLGGLQDINSPLQENWHWVTGEPWTFVNWASGEPNDAGGDERYLQMWGFGTVAPGRWNDDANDTNLGNIGGYFIEYETSLAPIPEPSTLTLTGIGLLIGAYERRRRAQRTDKTS